MKRREVTEPEAMRLLQRQARRNRKPLVEIAQNLIENETLLSDDE